MIKSMTGMVVASLAFSCLAFADDDLQIEKFRFQWEVVSVGKNKLVIEKDEDKTNVLLQSNFDFLRLSGDEANALAEPMTQTVDMAKKLKGSTEKSEKVNAGDITVEFMTSKDGTFYVRLKRRSAVIGSSLMLDRESAVAFSKHLKKSKQMVALVDKKINP